MIVPLLGVTLGLRLMTGSATTEEDRARALADTVAILEGQGFAARIEVRDGPDAVLAKHQDCELAVSAGPVADKALDIFRRRYAQDRELSLFYRNSFVKTVPRLQSSIDYYAYRHLSPLGFAESYPPLIIIASTHGCNLDIVPWQQLRLHPRGTVRATTPGNR
ncbi:MAG: hypothetical protein ACKOUT_10280 [Novosphingobium sp.]